MDVSIISNASLIEQEIVNKMKQAGVSDIGCNPSLTDVINKTWKWPAFKIYFYFDEQLIAFASSIKIGKKHISMPHFDHGSLWISHELKSFLTQNTNQSYEILLQNLFYSKLIEILSETKISSRTTLAIKFCLMQNDFVMSEQPNGLRKNVHLSCRSSHPLLNSQDDRKVVPTLNLSHNWQKQISTFSDNVRRKINKSNKNRLIIKTGGKELIDDFYKVYRSNIHQLGSFGLPQLFFHNLLESYNYGQVQIFVSYYDNRAVGAAILMIYANAAENGWFASLKPFNRFYTTYSLHAAMIEFAINAGCSTYSFGRSTKQSKGHLYKKQWGTYDVPMYFNSNKKASFANERFEWIRPLLRKLPSKILRSFDWPVSQFIY